MKYPNRKYLHQSRTATATTNPWLARILFILGAMICVALLISNQIANPLTASIQRTLNDTVSPIFAFIREPVASTNSFFSTVDSWQQLQTDKTALQQENTTLRQWQHRAELLTAENEQLKKLLNYKSLSFTPVITTPVLGQLASPYGITLNIPAGSTDGVTKGMAAIHPLGLVGRIRDAGQEHARIMPVTDINSRIAVLAGKSRSRAIAAGRNDGLLNLHFLEENIRPAAGEKIFTSGDSGLLPANILVGTVVESDSEFVKVKPAVNFTRLDNVLILKAPDTPSPTE